MSQESFALWITQQYQLPESALSALGNSKDPRYWSLKVPAREGKPAHHLIFSDGLAASHGIEFTLRVSGSPLEDERLPMMLLLQLLYYREMLDGGAEVNLYHSVPLGGMMPFPWTDPQFQKGDSSALLVADPVLKHPRIKILGLLCQSPLMKFATATLPNLKVAELLTPLVPDLITNLDTPPNPNQPELAAAFKRLAESSPQTPMIQGLMFELRLRQQGQALDFLVGPRWVAPILHAVEQVYGKDAGTVLPGSTITCVNESHTGILVIRHHDDDGQPVQEGAGRFRILEVKYARVVTPGLDEMEPIEVEEAQGQELALLSESELYQKHDLIRHISLELLAPRSLLRRMLTDTQTRLGVHDFDQHPACIFDYCQHFSDQQFRLIAMSGAYFQDEIGIDDSGNVVPVEAKPETPIVLTHHEFYQALLAWMKNPKLEGFLALRQQIVRSPDYQPYKEPRPLDELRQAVGERRHKDILTIFEQEGISLLLSPEAHMAVTIAHKHLGNSELELQSRWLSKLCGEAIEQSGDGSLDRPYLVLHINDEYDFLRRHELVPAQQSLVHHGGRSLDVMTLNTGRKIAFDVTDMQNAMFGGSAGGGSASDVLAILAAAQAQQDRSPPGISPKGCFLAFLLGAVLMVISTVGLRRVEDKELAGLWSRIEAASKAGDTKTVIELAERIETHGTRGSHEADFLRACKVLYPRLVQTGDHARAREILADLQRLSPELAATLEKESKKGASR